MTEYKLTPTKSYDTIKLGIDAHAKWYYVARQLDGATPQAVQKMDFHGLLRFVAKQQGLAGELHTCYNRAERDRLAERQPEGQERGRLSTLGPSATTCTASSWRWECTTWWCSRRTGTSGARE
jgi:hypothetical protein